jgi:dTDP-glucose 4,6-dehydratase
MNILVTGGCGFIGSNLVKYLRRTRPNYKVVNLDALTYAGNLENLKEFEKDPHYSFVKGDILNRELVDHVLLTHKIDSIMHLAAESHVDRSILGPEAFIKTNILGTQTLLEAARQAKLARFLMVSTDEVYGSLGPTGLFTETTPLDPSSPYSASKTSSDLLALAYEHTFGLDVVVTRCSNNYGPFQFPEKLIPLMIANALNDKPLPVYGSGTNVRDWLQVEDHCSALTLALEKGTKRGVYNIGGNSERQNIFIVKTILAALGKPESLIKYVADRPGHDMRYAIDATKINNELGWTPSVTFEKGMEATVKWYLDHRPWWERVMSGEYRKYFETQYAGRLRG